MYVSFANKQNQLNFNYIENNISSSIIHFYGIKFRKGNVNNFVNINVFLYNMIMLRTKKMFLISIFQLRYSISSSV